MRICAITLHPPTVAGVADYGAYLARTLARDERVDHVAILANRCAGAPCHERAGGVDVHRVWRCDRPGTGLALLRSVRRLRPDVVWCNLGLTMFGTSYLAAGSGLMVPLLARLLGFPTVVTLHEVPALADLAGLGLGDRSMRLGADLATWLALQANVVVVTIGRYLPALAERFRARNVRHIPHGVWQEPELLAEPDEEAVLVLGTFAPHKDPGLVARAVQQLRRQRPRLRLLVAGADHPRYPGFTERWHRGQPLGDACEWLGHVPAEQLPAAFRRATVVVLPARAATGSSGVMYRAIAYGRPVLIGDLPDYRALAVEEDLRLSWYSPGDTSALARALEALLDDPAGRAAAVEHNLRAAERLAPTALGNAYLGVFAAAIDQSRAMPATRQAAT